MKEFEDIAEQESLSKARTDISTEQIVNYKITLQMSI